MGAWTIEELETAFARYKAAVQSSVESGDWTAWADLFTEDVDYIEHMYGPMKGRGAVLRWMTETMSTYPNNAMEFPFGWHVVDEARGWIQRMERIKRDLARSLALYTKGPATG